MCIPIRKGSFNQYVAPVFVSVFPPVFIYQVNMYEVPLSAIIMPLFVAACFALILAAVLFLFTKRAQNSSLAACFLIAAFYSYGSLYDAIDSTSIQGLFSSQLISAGLFMLICLGICLLIFRLKDESRLYIVSWYVSTFVLLLVCLNIALIGYKLVCRGETGPAGDALSAQGSLRGSQEFLPDIYYIILDEYASTETIKSCYNYDNASFEGFLEKYGFFISHSSVTKYDSTDFALAANLNMTYVDGSLPSRQLYTLISGNSVAGYLKSLGYRYIHIGSSMEINKIDIKSADIYFNYFGTKRFYLEDDFLSRLIDMSLLRPLFYTMNWTKLQQEAVHYSFNKLEETIGDGCPKYVFAHILCPHHPFVFDSGGGALKIRDRKNWEDKNIYLGQYIYVSKMVENFVAELMLASENTGRKPVVIIQSDHGPRKIPGASFEEKYRIFNAMYLPDGGAEKVYDGISPVNTFPVIFNSYFGDNIKLVDDR